MITKKSGCVVISKDDYNKVMLLYRNDNDGATFPKGHLEVGETLEDCALREVYEETGLKVKIIGDFGFMEYKDSLGKDVITTYFIALSLDDSKINPENDYELEWCDIDSIKDKIIYENLRNFFCKNVSKLKNVII
ncbi:MAG: putative mutator protein MutT4 [Alphaproteobacteria bacterium ADurb.Bin438]|nr:MAG: putative mutator protein MutT4 [Alphaproteobacteria bacterium ADurb.Bin438]